MGGPSLDLLNSLESKLKAANIRSPYLRATIGRSRNRFDLHSLNLLTPQDADESLPDVFLNQLMNEKTEGKVNLTFSVNAENAKGKEEEERVEMDTLMTRFQNIHFDQEEDFAEHGTKSFGFGYPLVALTANSDKNRVILAPLFIWSLDINPLPNNHHAYSVSRIAEHPIIRNPQLSTFLLNEYGLTLDKIPEDLFENGCLTKEELDELLASFCDLTNAEVINPDESAASIKKLDYYGRMVNEKPLIYKAGIFTLFKSNRESIVADYEAMIRGKDDLLFDDPAIYKPYQKDYFASTPLDPSQEGILRNIADHKKVIIQGPPGTGKSNSLSGIILNALENGAKTLVVCEKKTALEVIEENLRENGLDNLCAVIDNITSDRQKMVRALRDRFDNRDYLKPNTVSLSEYKNIKEEYSSFYEILQSKYGNLLTKIVGDLSWKDCIGNFLKAQRENGIENQLTLQGFDPSFFTEKSLFRILNVIKESSYLVELIQEEIKIFHPLSDDLFKEKANTRFIQEQIESFEAIDDKEYRKWRQFTDEELQQLSNPSFGLKIKSWFNSDLKAKIQLLDKLRKNYNINHPLLKLFQEKVGSENVINQRNHFVQCYNQLQEVISKKARYRDYHKWRNFYLTELDSNEKKIIDELLHFPIRNWENSFRKWFFNESLLLKEIDLGEFPTSDRELDIIVNYDDKIDQQQRESIQQFWKEKQKETAGNRTLKSLRLLFNLRSNKTYGRRNSLRHLMHDEFELITSFFPVVLVNPSVCSSIFPLKQGLFDIVIFDEASQLRLEDTFPALIRGRFKIISGDVHQMPPSTHFRGETSTGGGNMDELEDDVVFAEEESLLTYAQNSDFEFNYLDFHYRSQHPHLIDFSNAAFYGKRLVPMPPTYHGTPIEMIQVNGIYDDNRNEAEVDKILEFLFQKVEKNEDGNYPSIGIATFNMSQQRYIWERIWSLADENEEARTRLAELESAGLFVKNLENIQGDQRDIIIITTTFGVRPDGRFIQNFGPINRDKGYKLLNVIVTRAKQKIVLLTSIPSEYYNSYRNDIVTKGNTGKGIFYAYLTYAKLCSDGNEEGRKELLKFLMEHSGEEAKEEKEKSKPVSPDNYLTESVFEEEVIEELLKFTKPERIITQYEMGGFRLDIVITDEAEAPQVVIECDGKTYHSSKVAYRYDIHRQKILERHGLNVYRIWSTNWWRDKEREAKKLKAHLREKVADAVKG